MNYGTNMKGKILVADDLECSRGILKLLLRHDYDVVEAADGFEAVEFLKKNDPCLVCVMLDIKMPGMDGYGVLDYMRDSGLSERVPVIALTALSDPQGLIRCFQSGAVDLIEKPYNEELLLYKVKWNISRFRRLNGKVEESDCPQGPVRAENAVTRHLREAYGLDTPEEVDDMYHSFLKTLDDCVDRLVEQLEEPDMMAVRDVTHDIFGFAQSAGAVDLNDLTKMLNTCAKAGDRAAVQAGIRRIVELRKTY